MRKYLTKTQLGPSGSGERECGTETLAQHKAVRFRGKQRLQPRSAWRQCQAQSNETAEAKGKHPQGGQRTQSRSLQKATRRLTADTPPGRMEAEDK